MPAIQPGQEYESCLPTYYGSAGEEHTRIRVKGHPIPTRHLHPTGSLPNGQPRRTGYRLVRHPDGSEA